MGSLTQHPVGEGQDQNEYSLGRKDRPEYRSILHDKMKGILDVDEKLIV